MPILGILVLAGVCAVVLLLSMSFDASGVEARKRIKQRLESVSLAANRSPDDEGVGLVREELLSSIPWMKRWLPRQDFFAGLRQLLNQA